MYIFQVNDKLPMSDINIKEWSDYLETQCEKDTAVLLPPNIDFISAINLNQNIEFMPIYNTEDEYGGEDGGNYEDIELDN